MRCDHLHRYPSDLHDKAGVLLKNATKLLLNLCMIKSSLLIFQNRNDQILPSSETLLLSSTSAFFLQMFRAS
jgi:hypothetical protein